MLASDAPIMGYWDANGLDFWHQQVSKAFSKFGYYIRKLVLHRVKASKGKVLHSVSC